MTPPADCLRLAEFIERVTLGEEPVAALVGHPHLEACAACADQAALVGRLRPMPVVVPAGFAERTAARVLRDRRNRQWQRRAVTGGLAVAAAVLVGWFALAQPNEPTIAEQPQPQRPPVAVRESLAEAGSALVSLSRKAADESLTPALSLFQAGEKPAKPVEPPRPAADAIAGLPDAAKGGLDPMADAARRAVRLFVRDLGRAADGKSNS